MYKNFYIIFVIFLIDYISKLFIIMNFKENEYKKIFYILNILYVRNYGIAFNFLTQYKKNDFIFLNFFIISFLIIQMLQKNEKIYQIIIGGSISNIFDKLYYGFVVDFIDINNNHLHYIIFNFADIMILFGIVIKLYQLNKMNK